MSATPHDPELRSLEKSLQALVPHTPALDRDRLMFRAGSAAARKRLWLWPGLAVAAGLVCLAVSALWFFQSEPPAKERIVYVYVPASDSVSPATASLPAPSVETQIPEQERHMPERTEYRNLLDQVVRMGVDALPQPGPDRATSHFVKPLSRGSLADQLSSMP
jgi:hypothetical protein